MDFNLKTYKHFKIKHYLRRKNLIFFFHGTSLNNESWIKIEQILFSHQLKYFRILNKLTINTLKNSIFKNLTTLIHGPIFILNSNNTRLTFKKLANISPFIDLLGIRLNYRVYSKEQVNKLKKLTYLENFCILHNSMKAFMKKPYYTFKSKKVLPMSK
jgi:hypothetical protein